MRYLSTTFLALVLLLYFGLANAATVQITWTDTNHPPANEDNYFVEWRNVSAAGPWNNLVTTMPDVTTAVHNGAPEGIEICYRVTALSATRSDGVSQEACLTPVTLPLNPPDPVSVEQTQ